MTFFTDEHKDGKSTWSHAVKKFCYLFIFLHETKL